jgi:hypothetical protein
LPRIAIVVFLFALLAACAGPPRPAEPPTPIPITAPQEAKDAPVVRREVPPVAIVPPPAADRPLPPATTLEPAPVAVPADAIYVCVSQSGGVRHQTVIEFAPKVHALCRKHPEMGPCQYERDICRKSGGRVFAANGNEITLATEAEYDRKVLRVRFRAN